MPEGSVSGGFWYWVMAEGLVRETGSEWLAEVRTALATLRTAQVRLASGPQQLALLKEGLQVEGQLHTWLAQLSAQIDTAEVAWAEHGTSTATWLADAANLTRREAARLIAAGQGLARFGIVAAAAASGGVGRPRPRRSPGCRTTCLRTSLPM